MSTQNAVSMVVQKILMKVWDLKGAGRSPAHENITVHTEIDLTNVRELRNLLSAHNMRPSKSFGQHLLIDRSVLLRIVEAAEIDASDQGLELGAGTGVRTREWATCARRVGAAGLRVAMLPISGETPHC